MRVLAILPGSGGSFYCQNCLRDLAMADAMRRRGHRVTLMPLYLPATETIGQSHEVPVFYGAVTLYLRHRYAWLRRLPREWFRPLDSWPVLRLAARLAGTTSAAGLEDLTLSMLRGPDGRQADELRLVADWINDLPPAEKPEIIVLSNALLSGLAGTLKRAAGCPVVCWLQDEHVWLDAMAPSLSETVSRVLSGDALTLDGFIAVSSAYADRMATRLRLDRTRITVVAPGVAPTAYRPSQTDRQPPTIGFLSRLSAEEGFDRFVDAFLILHRDPRFRDVRLAATGGPPADRTFLKRQHKKIADADLSGAADIEPHRFVHDRTGFLSELTILSVPGSATPEAFGYYAIEAMAAGVPIVMPAQGAFPEIAAAADCGTLVHDPTPENLAQTWAALLTDPARLHRESELGRAAARTVFSIGTAAARYENALRGFVAP